MNNVKSSEIGKYGETVARDFLISKGHTIEKSNYHSRYGEIDIIAKNNDFIIFVEVKARSENSIDRPISFVTKSKQNKIIKTALDYIGKNHITIQPRFDIIEVFLSSKKIRHIKNAFLWEEEYAPF